jgi:hypothetical protein
MDDAFFVLLSIWIFAGRSKRAARSLKSLQLSTTDSTDGVEALGRDSCRTGRYKHPLDPFNPL